MANDAVFKALADPTRRKILRLLNGREMTAGQLAEQFGISAPSMSHHFNLLKQADLIFARREGQQIFYSLNTTVFQDMISFMMDLFTVREVEASKDERTQDEIEDEETRGKGERKP